MHLAAAMGTPVVALFGPSASGALRPALRASARVARRPAVQPVRPGAAAARTLPRTRARLHGRHPGRRGRRRPPRTAGASQGAAGMTRRDRHLRTPRRATRSARTSRRSSRRNCGKRRASRRTRGSSACASCRYGGQTMRERFTYRGDSLWWFTELYLHKMRRLDRAVSVTLALDAARERHAAVRLAVDTADLVTRDAAHAFGRARGCRSRRAAARSSAGATPGRAISSASPPRSRGCGRRCRRRAPSRPSSPRSSTPRSGAPTRAATARDRKATSGRCSTPSRRRLAPAICAASASGRDATSARADGGIRWSDRAPCTPMVTPIERLAPRERARPALDLWRRRSTLARRDRQPARTFAPPAMFRGCDLWPILRRELEAVALAAVAVVGARDGRSGRRASTRSRRSRASPTRRRAAGAARSCSKRAAAASARSASSTASSTATGSTTCTNPTRCSRSAPIAAARSRIARWCSIATRQRTSRRPATFRRPPSSSPAARGSTSSPPASPNARRRARRFARELGVAPTAAWSCWPRSSPRSGSELPDADRGGRERCRRCAWSSKSHPAETADGLRRRGRRREPASTVAPAATDLARLLAAADALVTMNSTVAIDGLVLGVPALVIGLPNNLSPFVDAGVMLGRRRRRARFGQALRGAPV